MQTPHHRQFQKTFLTIICLLTSGNDVDDYVDSLRSTPCRHRRIADDVCEGNCDGDGDDNQVTFAE
jgi:hypothetical protein